MAITLMIRSPRNSSDTHLEGYEDGDNFSISPEGVLTVNTSRGRVLGVYAHGTWLKAWTDDDMKDVKRG